MSIIQNVVSSYTPSNNKKTPPVRKSQRKRSNTSTKRDTNTNKNKKFKNDKEIVDIVLGSSSSSDNLDDDEDDELNDHDYPACNNPLCDHKEYSKAAYEEIKAKSQIKPPKTLASILDLIQLGKTYHCKMNTTYFGLNLKLMCNLVEPLTKLKNMVGMKEVKENMVNQIIFFLQNFNQKEKCNNCMDCICNLPCTKNMNDDMLHTVITGPPGVGKTELGKIVGQVYKAMGVLSNGEMQIATRSDLVGKFLGHTADKTQKFIDKCKGGVMFIDEAYSLGNSEGRDSFSKECLDTLNQNMSERRDFLVIIAGYADALDKCFFSYNEGLRRRFTFRYDIIGYTAPELLEIFLLKVKNDDWKTEFELSQHDNVSEREEKEKNRLKVVNFFEDNLKYFPHYGGDIESFLLNCKVIHGKRVVFLDQIHKKVLTVKDIHDGLEQFVHHRKYDKTQDIMSDNIWRMYT